MDIQAYIQSGIIESYVLGLATDVEVAEVEQLSLQYPEVQQAIDDFATSVEQQAMANAVIPPAQLKEKIMNTLGTLHTPMPAMSVVTDETEMKKLAPVRSLSIWRNVAAASLIGLVISVGLNLYFHNLYKSSNSQYQALLIERNSLQASNDVYQTKVNDWQLAAQMMANPGMLKVTLAAIPGKESTLMTTIFWDKNSKDVYLLKNKLPTPAADKQYQLWALVDGKPVDAGMIDSNCEGACKMKNIPRAQAFAITLENKGGSATPTMAQMFVMGTV